YAARYRNYWKNQNVIHEEFSLIFAAARRMIFKPFHQMDQDRYRQFGKLFGVYEAAKPLLFVADPELVKRVLVKDFPSLPNRRVLSFNDSLLDNMMSIIPVEKWRRIRPAASPAFSTGKLRKLSLIAGGRTLDSTAPSPETSGTEANKAACQFGQLDHVVFGFVTSSTQAPQPALRISVGTAATHPTCRLTTSLSSC
ncbi:cytochrome P450 3A24, partial [Ixodes scapularis]